MPKGGVKVHFDRNYQPGWDAGKELKPPKVMAGEEVTLTAAEAKPLLQGGVCRRVSDMPGGADDDED